MRLGRYIGMQQNFEILCLSLFGIVCTIFDASLLDFNSNIYKIWEIKMDPDKFSDKIELYMKYLLTVVVLIRTFTVHVYLVCYIMLLYPVYFKEKAVLILPWILINAIKCLFTGFITLFAGVYTCSVYKFVQPTCWEFMLTQFLEHAPSVYMFQLVLEHLKYQQVLEEYKTNVMKLRRRSVKSFPRITPPESFIEDHRKLISVSTIENVILHFTTNSNKGTSRSMDTLLDHMKCEEEREEMVPSLEDAVVDDESLSIKERTTRTLQLTKKDIETAVKERDERLSQGKKANKSMTSLTSNPIFRRGQPKPMDTECDLSSISSEHEVMNVFPDTPSSYKSRSVAEDLELPGGALRNVGVSFDHLKSPSFAEMREREILKGEQVEKQGETQEEKREEKQEELHQEKQEETGEETQEDKREDHKLLLRNPMTTFKNHKAPSIVTSVSKMEGSLPFKEEGAASRYKDDGYTQALLDSISNNNKEKPASTD